MVLLADDLDDVAGAGTYAVLTKKPAGGALEVPAVRRDAAVLLKARKGIYIIDAPDCFCYYSEIMIFSRNIITPYSCQSTEIPGSGSIGSV